MMNNNYHMYTGYYNNNSIQYLKTVITCNIKLLDMKIWNQLELRFFVTASLHYV